MKEILIYPIKSLMHHDSLISNDSNKLLNDLLELLGTDYSFKYINDFNDTNDKLVLILVQSGGSEGIFKKEVYPNFGGPYYLLAYGSSNSLPASLEILSFLKQNNKPSEVLHGNNEYIVTRIKDLYNKEIDDEVVRLGVFGKPSDWLISSNVDYSKCKEVFGIELVDVDEEEIVNEINEQKEVFEISIEFKYNKEEVNKALKIYQALKHILIRHSLKGFTIRCFDIIAKVHSSACLALALLNKEGYIASCEGDIPAMITMYLVKKLTNQSSFQANPQWIDPINNTIDLAHCTIPFDMCERFSLDTHFESGIGVGIHGELKENVVTIFKVSNSCDVFYCETGTIVKNEYRHDRCRTQIRILVDSPISYFLTSSIGNHHIVFYGDHKEEITNYLKNKSLRRVI